jgi:signal transduction histidine kinase/CheY-like chemotaxis protein
VLNGFLFGALWGVIPAAAFPGGSPPIQLFIAVLTSGMMCAGGFVLAPVPLAGVSYIAVLAAASFYALLQQTSPVYLGLIALTAAYTTVLIASVNWSASLLVSSRLAEAQLRDEVAARETAQIQAAHAERMSALGALAGGIAHDFNNILQAVSAGAQLIERRPADSDYVRRYAEQIEAAVERGAAISHRLLGFARQDVLQPELIEADELFDEVRELLAHTIDASIKIKIDVAVGAPGFVADRFRLETVLLNLATNARDAMPGGGTLTISATDEASEHATETSPLKAGRYVRITVSDTGSGMDVATLQRAGQPFFTTKPKGKGTGLGLSMAREFAEQSGGSLTIASALGQGASVVLRLPRGDLGRVVPGLPEILVADTTRARNRVMLVDDDDAVRAPLARSLEDFGFLVASVESAERALDQIRGGLEIDGVVTDLSMPGMSGWDLIQELRSLRPHLPSLMLTGHLERATAETLEQATDGRFLLLRKPVPPALLAKRLSALLNNPAAASADGR